MLLAVKFHIPEPGPVLTERLHLLERFHAGLARPLILISAPAGFGKSTLLGAWLGRQLLQENPSANDDILGWLSLDSADNHPPRFWTYLTAAIQEGMQRRAYQTDQPLNLKQLLEYLQSDPPPAISAVLDELINTISASAARIVLVLDDYHAIQTPEIHEQMTYLVEHQPPNLHLVISTRVDPPLPITRLRARGKLSEFRAADLRFSIPEAAGFLHDMTGIDLLNEEVAAIHSSTEGWIAGLQMAALALQAMLAEDAAQTAPIQPGKIQEFVNSFSGKHLYVLDYLTDEVFNRQPVEIQSFLLKTSILDRMSVGLCAAVVMQGEGDQAVAASIEGSRLGEARSILEYLEKSNLFLIRLDNERQWFRYHHLFSDLLRARLEQTWPDALANLHRKASRWYEQNGFVDDAIQHVLSAQDWDLAAKLMETHVTTYLEQGQLAMVLKWINALPDAVLRSRPMLCVQIAEALAHAGQFQRVPPLLEMVETALATPNEQTEEVNPLAPHDRTRTQGIAMLLRAFGLILTGNPGQAIQLAQNALKALPDLEHRELAWLHWVCGYAYRSMGQLDQAIQSYESALRYGRVAGTMLEDMYTDLAIAYRFNGQLSQAIEVFQHTLNDAETQGIRNKGNLSRVESFLSSALLDQGRLEEALEHAQKGVYYLQWWPSHNHITTAYIYLGQVLLGMDRLDQASEAIQRAEQELHKGQVVPILLHLVENVSIRLWLRRGEWDRVENWLSAQAGRIPDLQTETGSFNEQEAMRLVSLARVWIASGRKESAPVRLTQAFQLLTWLDASAQRSHWVHALVEINLLQAVTLYEMGKRGVAAPVNAQTCLTNSLRLGIPAGYVQVYLQEGAAAADLLQTWLTDAGKQASSTNPDPILVKTLLERFHLNQPTRSGTPRGKLIEPLTNREQEVLQLLALGLSNKAMAERLVVSEGTIKTHVHNLIGKLGAQSRTHVLARARELELL